MKICIVGVLDQPYSSNFFMKIALESFGHSVLDYNYRTKANEFGSYQKMCEDFLKFLQDKKPELTILCKTNEIDASYVSQWAQFTKLFYWFPDTYEIAMSMKPDIKEILKNVHYASCKNFMLMPLFESCLDKSRVAFISNGIDENLYRDFDKKRTIDVCMVGTRSKRREFILDQLNRRGVDVLVHGPGWESGPLYNEKLVDEFNRSKIVLNFEYDEFDNLSDHHLKALACGAMPISEGVTDLRNNFIRRVDLDWWKIDDYDEAATLIKFYLRNDKRRRKIIEIGKKHVLENYTWKHSMQKVLTLAGFTS